ncbi:YaaC family protein [Cystobacter fuscus]
MPQNRSKVEHLVAENVSEAVWLRFRRLTSPTLCRRILTERAPALDSSILDKKSEGLASAIQSALGYWETETRTLNAKVLTRYYAILQVSIAEQVASVDPTADLADAQRHTEQGHGFAALQSPDGEFPHNYHVACMQNGHFAAYCRSRGVDLSQVAFEKRPREWARLKDGDKQRLISLADLLRRIPELRKLSEECLGGSALSFHIGHASKNSIIASNRASFRMGVPGRSAQKSPEEGADKITYGAIYADPEKVGVEFLRSLGLPFKNIQLEQDELDGGECFIGEVHHPSAELWWNYFESYKSGYCGTSVVAPFWGGITDVFVIHFAALYALSIVVRYLPSLWHQVEHGRLDHIRALIENYLSIVDNVGPTLALERITGTRLVVSTPDSLNAPV